MPPLSIGKSKARLKDVKSVAVLCCAQQTINRHVKQLSREVNFGKTIGFKALKSFVRSKASAVSENRTEVSVARKWFLLGPLSIFYHRL